MRSRHIVFFILLTFLFLFYPGNYFYRDLFVYNPQLFAKQEDTITFTKTDIPHIKNPFSMPFITAQGSYVVDLATFTPVFSKNEHMRLFPASTTKMLTALVAYDRFSLDDTLVAHNIVNIGQVMGLVEGEKMTFENMLYGLLVYSGNDVAYAIADNYPGGRDVFVQKMNQKAASLSMRDSHFENPAGLDAQNQYSSAFDLALVGREVLKNKELSKIVSTKSITVSDEDFKYFHDLTNVNKLLGEIPGVGGLKTGYTEEAGENLVSFYKKGDHRFLIVILKSQDRFLDTRSILTWIDSNIDYFSSEVVK
jgi:D-alanyl-D-alanine carboxypeptidase